MPNRLTLQGRAFYEALYQRLGEESGSENIELQNDLDEAFDIIDTILEKVEGEGEDD